MQATSSLLRGGGHLPCALNRHSVLALELSVCAEVRLAHSDFVLALALLVTCSLSFFSSIQYSFILVELIDTTLARRDLGSATTKAALAHRAQTELRAVWRDLEIGLALIRRLERRQPALMHSHCLSGGKLDLLVNRYW